MIESLEKNWKIFPGFKIERVVTGLHFPVNIAFVPDPRDKPNDPLFYVTELYGNVKVVTNDRKVYTYAEKLLNYEPNYKLPGSGESGLMSLCVEQETGDLFLTMIYLDDNKEAKAKVVRTKSKDGLKMESMETVIDDLPTIMASHQIQDVTIGSDKKLYINMGDGMYDPKKAQDDKDPRGKVLRINMDGSIPEDNPNPKSYVFAKGFRNPFGAAWRKSDDSLYVNINGPEIDDTIVKVEAGGNYGWPDTMRKNYIFVWHFTQAPTAMDFMQNDSFPEEFRDELFVALFGPALLEGWDTKGKKIVKIKLNDDATAVKSYDEFVTYIGQGPASPCGLAFGPDGLYFTDLHGEDSDLKKPTGNVFKVIPVPHTGPRIPNIRENKQRCICGGCPSWNDCMKNGPELLYCAKGGSHCDIDKKGCICGECPIANDYNIAGFYYCIEGAAKWGGGFDADKKWKDNKEEEKSEKEQGGKQKMEEMSMEEKKKFVMKNCTCENCPSYKDCSTEGGSKEKGFCAPFVGKSKCISEEKGCICASCPVYAKMSLKNQYYCTRDSEKVQQENQ